MRSKLLPALTSRRFKEKIFDILTNLEANGGSDVLKTIKSIFPQYINI